MNKVIHKLSTKNKIVIYSLLTRYKLYETLYDTKYDTKYDTVINTLKKGMKMALTSAERQATFKQKREALMQSLASQNEALTAKNARLQAENRALIEKCHRLEIAALKAQIKRG